MTLNGSWFTPRPSGTRPGCPGGRRWSPSGAVAEVRAEGLITATGRTYRQEYVLFLRAEGGRIANLREFFDPVRAARALDAPIADGR